MGVARGPKDVENFPFVEPPDSRAINDGVTLLRELGALTSPKSGDAGGNGRSGSGLTAVGQKLAQLPVDPRLGRMIVEAGKRGCVREVMILAAALTIQDPPVNGQQTSNSWLRRSMHDSGTNSRTSPASSICGTTSRKSNASCPPPSSASYAATNSSITCACVSGRTSSPSSGRWPNPPLAYRWTTNGKRIP